jgi:hypothetical protein
MTVSDDRREEPWMMNPDNDAGSPAAPAGDQPGDDEFPEDQPVELTDEASRLDLEDDDPPLPWLQGDDDDADFEGSGIGQTIAFVVLGLLAIALIGGAIWWVGSRSDDKALVADGSIIKAPPGPYKERPDSPGGKVFEGTGDTSFGISEGQKRPARLGQEDAPQPGFTPADKPAAKGAPSPAASGTPAAPANVPGVGVQVAAYSNMQQAEDGWTRLSQQYSALSGAKHRVVQGQADIGTVYRLQAVTPDLAGAKALCQQLKAAGLNCQVKN